MGSRLLARRALISLVLLGAVTGCGGDATGEATTPVPVVSSPTPEPSPTPTPLATAVPLPVMPPAMAHNDAAGAEAAVRYFVALADYTLATGDAAQWTAMTDDDCVFCQSIEESALEISSENWDRGGGGLTVDSIRGIEPTEIEGLYFVDALVTEEAHQYVAADGAVVESVDAGSGLLSFGVQFAGNTWLLVVAGEIEGSGGT